MTVWLLQAPSCGNHGRLTCSQMFMSLVWATCVELCATRGGGHRRSGEAAQGARRGCHGALTKWAAFLEKQHFGGNSLSARLEAHSRGFSEALAETRVCGG